MFRLDTPGPVEPLTGREVQTSVFHICVNSETELFVFAEHTNPAPCVGLLGFRKEHQGSINIRHDDGMPACLSYTGPFDLRISSN
jgi:hypothetical protein